MQCNQANRSDTYVDGRYIKHIWVRTVGVTPEPWQARTRVLPRRPQSGQYRAVGTGDSRHWTWTYSVFSLAEETPAANKCMLSCSLLFCRGDLWRVEFLNFYFILPSKMLCCCVLIIFLITDQDKSVNVECGPWGQLVLKVRRPLVQ